jgi:hypothetical protein
MALEQATVAREVPAYAGFYTGKTILAAALASTRFSCVNNRRAGYEATKRSLTPFGSSPTTPIYLISGELESRLPQRY